VRVSKLVSAVAGGLVAAAALTGCSGGGDDKPDTVAAGCAPASSSALVALGDPKGLVTADVLIPAVSAKAKYNDLLSPLTRVSVALDQVSLNSAADKLDGKKASAAALAAAFFKAKRISIAKDKSGSVVVATTADPARRVTAAFYAEGLKRAGYTVTTRELADDKEILGALKRNSAQVAPQFTESALAMLQPSAAKVAAKDKSLQKTVLALSSAGLKAGVVYASPAKAGLQPVYAVPAAVASKHNLASLEDFAKQCSGSGTVLAADPTCAAAGGCADGLAAKYGIKVGTVNQVKDSAEATKAAKSGKATLVAVAANDPALTR
jgi:osmoprotectant transport system substrate-binding protein